MTNSNRNGQVLFSKMPFLSQITYPCRTHKGRCTDAKISLVTQRRMTIYIPSLIKVGVIVAELLKYFEKKKSFFTPESLLHLVLSQK